MFVVMDHPAPISWSQSFAMVALLTRRVVVNLVCIGDLALALIGFLRSIRRDLFGLMFQRIVGFQRVRRRHGIFGMASVM